LVWAQQNIQGVVKDVYGDPVIGASIVEKGTTNGTITDLNGQFAIQLHNSQSVLTVSYIGYVTQDIVPQANMEIVLKEDATSLSEVVVTGYAVQKRINLSGAVDQVSQKTLQARPMVSIAQGLQGVVPNLNLWFGSGAGCDS